MHGDIADFGTLLNFMLHNDHVPEIEQFNRTIKEQVCRIYNMPPFIHLPPMFIIDLVYHCVFWPNMFVLPGGISTTHSPWEIILGGHVKLNACCKLEFGEYVQTHEEHDSSMKAHTVGAMTTQPTMRSSTRCII